MALPTLTKNPTQVKTGPGIILFKTCVDATTDAAALPVMAVAASKFTNSWTGWLPLGFTDEGMSLTFGKESEEVVVAEDNFPIRTSVTKLTGVAAFDMSGINQENVKLAMSGGNWSVSSSGATKLSKYSPPAPSAVTRVMLGFIGADSDEVIIAYQCFQTGEVSLQRKKGAEKASLKGVTLNFEVPSTVVSNDVWNYWTAGTWADALTAY